MPGIIREGLYRGDVPLVAGKPGYRGVWFTTDDDPTGHGLSDGETIALPEAERRLYKQNTGREAPMVAKTANKRAVRIEVIISSRDRNLIHWLPWSVKRTEPNLREGLITSGGGKHKAKTWYVYNGTIEPSRFKSISLKDDFGIYNPVSPDTFKSHLG